MTLNGSAKISISTSYNKSTDTFSNLIETLNINEYLSLSDTPSTGSVTTDKQYKKLVTLTASANQAYDLTNLTDNFNAAINFSNICVLYIRAVTGSVSVTAGSNFISIFNDSSDVLKLAESAATMYTFNTDEGLLVSSTTKAFTITNLSGSTSAIYEIIILGSSTSPTPTPTPTPTP